jgi:hypothetical protein
MNSDFQAEVYAHLSCHAHHFPPRFDHSNDVWRREYAMKFLSIHKLTNAPGF